MRVTKLKYTSMHPLILGVFAYLDTVPEDSIPKVSIFTSRYPASPEYLRKLADFINTLFRLQSYECPLRPLLARYRLYFRDDMALALAHAYMLHKDGKDPEEALTADYYPGFLGILTNRDLEKYRKAKPYSLKKTYWEQFRSSYEDGDRLVSYNWYYSIGLLLFRGDRLVWKYETARLSWSGVSLHWETNREKFIALGDTKGFLNGDFIWPPEDWVNPVTDEQEKAYAEEQRQSFEKLVMEAKAES